MKTIKPLLLLVLGHFIMNAATAQSVAINTDGSAADATAILDVKSTSKGMLIPRMTTAQRTGIATPATGLLVFDTDTNAFWYYNGTGWTKLDMAGNNWSTTGNSGTTIGTNFIGTTDDIPFTVKVNNQVAGYVSSTVNPGRNNTSWGYLGLGQNTTGRKNVAIGSQALMANTTGQNNTALGYQALMSVTTGNGNTAFGSQALFYNLSAGNTAIGVQSLFTNTNGYNNVGVGISSMALSTSGSYNTGIGGNSLISLTTGVDNTGIGYGADVSSGALTNATAIGCTAIVDASNKVRIGNSAVTVIEGQVPFTTPSDGRFKYNIKEDVKGLDFILQLRPVTYQFDVQRFDASMKGDANNMAHPVNNVLQTSYNEAAAIRRTGFIAQEVEQAAIKTGYDFSGINKPKNAADHYSLSYESFVVPLVKAVQEQNKQIEELKKTITMQQKALEELTTRLEKLEQQ
ncbi:tail fiber domain-containing protein [Niastella vici]|nr:tail fiber domain-containing protein [Niastella vici]